MYLFIPNIKYLTITSPLSGIGSATLVGMPEDEVMQTSKPPAIINKTVKYEELSVSTYVNLKIIKF